MIIVANKVDDQTHEDRIWDLMSLGMGIPVGISAPDGRGTGDLLDRVLAELETQVPFCRGIARG